nr:hypothetical protein [uncultured Endozoicomonas sp.]
MGEVVPLPGRTISNQNVQDADVLLVRSVTKVDQALVEGSSLKFVATATAGFDHVDRDYLASQGIAFSHAPGCNATAVTEYVVAVLDLISVQSGFELEQRTVGIVGKGQVGGRARWKIENETFNTLKTQGYHLEHNYGHGKQHLATNLASLTFTAFLINQIEQLACKFFRQALEAKKSKKALWHAIRGLFDWFIIDNWEDLFTAIIEGRSVSLKYLVVDTT